MAAAAGGTVVGVLRGVRGTASAGSRDVRIRDILGFEQIADFCKQFLGGWSGSLRVDTVTALSGLDELIDWHHDKEVDYCGDNEEVDRRGDDGAEVHKGVLCIRDLEANGPNLGGSKGVNDRLDNRVRHGFDDCGKGRTDDDRGGKFDDVATHNEVFEALEHGDKHKPFWE